MIPPLPRYHARHAARSLSGGCIARRVGHPSVAIWRCRASASRERNRTGIPSNTRSRRMRIGPCRAPTTRPAGIATNPLIRNTRRSPPARKNALEPPSGVDCGGANYPRGRRSSRAAIARCCHEVYYSTHVRAVHETPAILICRGCSTLLEGPGIARCPVCGGRPEVVVPPMVGSSPLPP